MPIVAQGKWRFCNKCQGLFFNGGGVVGVCPAGDGHDSTGSGDYALFADEDGNFSDTVLAQREWRFCNKCQGLFFNGGGVVGVCPAGDGHDSTGSGDYALFADEDGNFED